jgi:hypothetical protein
MRGTSAHPAAGPQLGATRVEVTVVSAPACHFCADAEEALAVLAEQYPLRVRVVELESPEGSRLTGLHRRAISPLVLVGGRFFSAGRLPRKKLTVLLQHAGVARTPSGDRPLIAS